MRKATKVDHQHQEEAARCRQRGGEHRLTGLPHRPIQGLIQTLARLAFLHESLHQMDAVVDPSPKSTTKSMAEMVLR